MIIDHASLVYMSKIAAEFVAAYILWAMMFDIDINISTDENTETTAEIKPVAVKGYAASIVTYLKSPQLFIKLIALMILSEIMFKSIPSFILNIIIFMLLLHVLTGIVFLASINIEKKVDSKVLKTVREKRYEALAKTLITAFAFLFIAIGAGPEWFNAIILSSVMFMIFPWLKIFMLRPPKTV